MDHDDHCLQCARLLDYSCRESHRRERCPAFLPRGDEECAAPRLRRRDYLPLAAQFGLLVLLGTGMALFWL